MTATYSGFLTKSIIFMALVILAMAASLYFGKTLGKNIMALTRSNLEERFQGQSPAESDASDEFVIDVMSGRTGFGYTSDEFGSNPLPRDWADPSEEELAIVGDEAVVEIEVLEGQEEEPEESTETSSEVPAEDVEPEPEEEEPETRHNLFDLGSGELVFRVQVGTFEERANAENVWARLTQAGFDARISTYREDDVLRYRVQVGDFPSQEIADAVAEELRSMNFGAWVFPVD